VAQNAGAQHTLVTSLPAGGRATTRTGGTPTAQVQRAASGGRSSALAGALPFLLTTATGGGVARAQNAGAVALLVVTVPTGGRSSATAGGVGRAFSYSISGYAKNGSTNAPLSGVRCKVYRFSDDQLMGTATSDGTGYYAVAIPRGSSSPLGTNADETFWVRFWKAGTPNLFATTDDDLVLIEAQTQGPP
jgi:hypothetical protein